MKANPDFKWHSKEKKKGAAKTSAKPPVTKTGKDSTEGFAATNQIHQSNPATFEQASDSTSTASSPNSVLTMPDNKGN